MWNRPQAHPFSSNNGAAMPTLASPASPEIYGLAEGPFWDCKRQRVMWVDINAGHVHFGELIEGQIAPRGRLAFDETVGAVVCSSDGAILVAGANGLRTIAPDGTTTIAEPLIERGKRSRLNDGGCDPAGRFLVGSLALDGRENGEFLWRISESGAVTVIDNDLTLSNGLGWSPDGRVLYSVDTVPGIVWQRNYDSVTGAIGTRSRLLHISDGSPDGLCLDTDGNLWIAIWGQGEVRCYSPTGSQLATILVAAPNVSSVAFIGPDLDILLITTASEELSNSQLAEYPDSGRLFTCRPGSTGLPVPSWSGFRE
jgi:sugar lactone lactonase YvrE